MSGPRTWIRIHEKDTVAVALADLPAGMRIEGALCLGEAIPKGHKFALCAIANGDAVIKYGMPIGIATAPISPGAWVHTHNLRTRLSGHESYTYEPAFEPVTPVAAPATFEGFLRANGEVGIRNELWIVPTVGCVNKVCETLAERFRPQAARLGLEVFAWPHPYGCSQLGEDHACTQKILAGLVRHPNAGGVLVVGLGCENNTLASFLERVGPIDPSRIRTLVVQEVEDELAEGLRLLAEMAKIVASDRRQTLPVSKLRVGLKCGGSDGLSGITANPLVGAFSDLLIRHGGTSILTEVPEMFGAETLLMRRCINETIFQKCVAMIDDFKDYFFRHNQVVYENPSPGNKSGGITTLEEKSLGCVQKGGSAPVVDILEIGSRPATTGLHLLTGPGNDMVAVTLLAASGAHLVLFTTGRGTPLGGLVPTLKIASNTPLAIKKPQWIDFDAGRLLGEATLPHLTAELFDLVLAIASGKVRTRNEVQGYREIAIFKDGVTL